MCFGSSAVKEAPVVANTVKPVVGRFKWSDIIYTLDEAAGTLTFLEDGANEPSSFTIENFKHKIATGEAKPWVAFRPLPGELRRRYLRGGLIYLVAATGPITYLDKWSNSEKPSREYPDDASFQQALDDKQFGLSEIDREDPAPEPVNSVDTRADRLKAAEEDTGFSLGEEVIIKTVPGSSNGKVVGFARVDEGGVQRVRKVVVQHTITVTEIFDPKDLL